MRTENNKVGYQFTPMPKQLTHLLDVNLRSMLFSLVDASDYFADEDGWFYRSNSDLQADSSLSQNLVKATVDTLYRYGLLEVSCVGKGKAREVNSYKLNTDMFQFFEGLDMNSDIKRPENRIKTIGYKGSGYHPSYLDDDADRFLPELVKGKIIWNTTNPSKTSTTEDTTVPTTESTKELTTYVTKSDNNIDNIKTKYNIDNINYKENVSNNEYNNSILVKNKEKEKLKKEFEKGITEPMTKDEEEGKEDPNEYQFENNNIVEDNQDSRVRGLQEGENHDAVPSPVQVKEEHPRPSSLRELQEHFLRRFKEEFKVNIPESEDSIQQSVDKLYEELEGFNDISSYKLVRFMIKDAQTKETDRLMARVLSSK